MQRILLLFLISSLICVFSEENIEIPTCSDALKKNPLFKGECLTEEVPSREDYEDMDDETSDPNTEQRDSNCSSVLCTPAPCPKFFKRDKNKKCRKVIKFPKDT